MATFLPNGMHVLQIDAPVGISGIYHADAARIASLVEKNFIRLRRREKKSLVPEFLRKKRMYSNEYSSVVR